VAHHGHLVQRWLTIEKHIVTVLQSALHDHPVVDFLVDVALVARVEVPEVVGRLALDRLDQDLDLLLLT